MTDAKLKLLIAGLILLTGCGGGGPYQVTMDPHGAKIVTGQFPVSLLASDSTFDWYAYGYRAYTPDTSVVSNLSTLAKGVHFVVVGGTWCGDTKEELPKFFKIMTAAKIPPEYIQLYGVDRSKMNGVGTSEKYDIVSVPTFILLSEGKELGRIVEYPKKSLELDMVDLLRKK